ncbi:uncharacterized protein NPIL_617271 [Nephila pilipes]|uniref:Uncharacterized protein n=1 Tax=Nephila pilipes TaxID=299642 RepID=A0A8X6TAU0_NEPPI|nr:uncharacterized protein NPIL_617271 [Nephila pilipes]
MSSLLHSCLVILVAVCTTSFAPVTCQDSTEDYRQAIAFNTSLLSENERSVIDTCARIFVRGVHASPQLKDCFDISDLPPVKFSFHVHKHFVLKAVDDLGASDFEYIADFATRPMAQNFDVFYGKYVLRVYANVLPAFLYDQGILTEDNVESLCTEYLTNMDNSCQTTVVPGDTRSKFQAITDGFEQTLDSNINLTRTQLWELSNHYQFQWTLTAVDFGTKSHLYNKCIRESQGYTEENSDSDSDTSSSGCDSSSSESDSSSSESDSSSSESDSSSSESDSSSSESDSSSSDSDSSDSNSS